jgi:hypothetical protein
VPPTEGIVGNAGSVAGEHIDPSSCVETASGVAQECRNANGRILIPVVEQQRSSANTGVKAGSGVAKERKPTNCCVRSAGGEVFKRIGPFCRSEVGIAAIRRRDNCLHWLQKREADEQGDKNQREGIRFHGGILRLLLSTQQRQNDMRARGPFSTSCSPA